MLRYYLLLVLFPIVECAKIGMFTVALSNSQMVFVLRIAEALAEDGHEVVVVRPEYNPTANSVKSSNPKIRDIFVKAAPLKAFEEYSRLKHRENFEDWTLFEYRELSKAVKNLVIEGCSGMLSNDEFIQQIKDEHFDLVFHGHLDFCLHGIAHHAGIRKWVTTMPMPLNAPHMRELQLPYFNSFLPGLIQNTTMYMSFVERAQTAFGDFFYGLVSASIIETPTTMLLKKKFGENFIAVSELRKQAILSFVNSDPFLEYPIPVTNKVQYIGGLGTKNPKELKEPFLSFAEKAKSVVVVSFGSVVTAADMPESWKEALLGLFRMNPEISFVWKFEEDIEVPKNVLRTKWFPQNDLLALNKTRVFITHGGYNSLGEAVQSATPCVFVPLATDQLRNSMLGQYRGIGVQLPKRELSAVNLHKKLHLILSNSSFRDVAKRYQTLGNSRINSPEEILRHWTNLILNHDLDLNLPNLSLVQLYNLDVYAFFFSLLMGSLFVLRTLWRWYCWSCCEMAYKEKEKLS